VITPLERNQRLNPNVLTERYQLSRDFRRAIDALLDGKAVILFDGTREIEGDIAFAAAHTTKQLVNTCLNHARGLLCVALPPDDALRIGVQRLKCEDAGVSTPPFGMPIDVAGLEHAASASARAATIRATADRSNQQTRFIIPGHMNTLIGHPLGLQGRFGHTECVIDLLMLAGIGGPGVLCEVLGEDGEIATLSQLLELAELFQFPLLDVSEVRELTNRIHRDARHT
jgi:3,4-dihydroxy-2-butanone 4-phosphate synthase